MENLEAVRAGAPVASGTSRTPLDLKPARCCICDLDDAEPVAVGEDFEYHTSPDSFLAVRCIRCGLIYLSLRPEDHELSRIYPPSYHAFDFSAERYGLAYKIRRWLEARRLLASCRGLSDRARILDVGCGDGFHLSLLKESGKPGWQLEGIDPSAAAVLAGARKGLAIHLGRVQDVDLAPESYDLALLISTVEHVDDPPGMLSAVKSLLRPGGKVLIVTDNTCTPDFRLFGDRHWGGFHFPRHWNLFSPDTLRALATKAGLEVESLKTIVSPVNWVYSVRNTLVDHGAPRWLYERFSLKSTVSLTFFTLVDLLYSWAGRGALLHAVFKRPLSG